MTRTTDPYRMTGTGLTVAQLYDRLGDLIAAGQGTDTVLFAKDETPLVTNLVAGVDDGEEGLENVVVLFTR